MSGRILLGSGKSVCRMPSLIQVIAERQEKFVDSGHKKSHYEAKKN